jgi:hypothetical protein
VRRLDDAEDVNDEDVLEGIENYRELSIAARERRPL